VVVLRGHRHPRRHHGYVASGVTAVQCWSSPSSSLLLSRS
jgi:hypothetical protein